MSRLEAAALRRLAAHDVLIYIDPPSSLLTPQLAAQAVAEPTWGGSEGFGHHGRDPRTLLPIR
jgi:hypothetical protein